jgi:hypothetical protein
MRLDLTDEETFALLNLLVDAIEADRYPDVAAHPAPARDPRQVRRDRTGIVGTGAEAPPLYTGRHQRAGQRRRNATRTGHRGKAVARGANA